MKRKGLTPTAQFNTIDLDVRSRRSLKPLLEAWSDIGIQADLAPQSFEEVTLGTETLHAIARVGGRVQITLRAPHREW
jgi:hypothetical protein